MSLSGNQPPLSVDAVVEESESRSETIETRSTQSKKKSVVWGHFVDTGDKKVVCKHCGSALSKVKGSGTSHLRRHLLTSCKSIGDEERANMLTTQGDDWFDPSTFKFDPELTRGLLTLFFIDAELPFSVTESRFFEPAMRSLRPEYRSVGRQTVREDCVAVFKAGCKVALAELQELDSRVSFTSDIWTSSANLGYLCLTAHWIDKGFQFQKRIIAFKKIPYPHSGQAVADLVEKIWTDWKLDDKIFAITLDNSSVNDLAVKHLESRLSEKMLFGASHMHMRCSAHILNLIAQEGMKLIHTTLENIRELLRHIGSSGSRLQVLNSILDELNLSPKKGLALDCPTRWNSTLLMIKEALVLKGALKRYVNDQGSIKGPSLEEWNNAEDMATFLEPFLDATKIFSSVRKPSSHTYIKEVWTIRRLLLLENHKDSAILMELAIRMQKKFDKYWENPNLILTLATIFDPRYKLIFLAFCFKKAYGEGREANARLDYIRDWLKKYYEEYEKACMDQDSSVGSSQGERHISRKRKLDEEFAQFKSENLDLHSTMSELEKYLQEKPIDTDEENFDILQYWKQNCGLYPTLAKMARDFLSVQASSVASEFAFSTAGRLTDHLRTSMNNETIECLVCSKDWFGPKEEAFDLNKYLPLIRR
ncbi:Zinc finger BED domain-containing protein DAYSLEEPER [Rhynchospora pubera]|uniref:Zinc finger BED domain-containing protein DAYSLEEPER n=1 Tax=Rhynchospora pubera TaxID=906938 RepID=A0AAV8FEP5_9POAL|nr:Zinc finger BED domain-containing protein DAYSLEEPER [Rhynchospora pubera]